MEINFINCQKLKSCLDDHEKHKQKIKILSVLSSFDGEEEHVQVPKIK